MSNPREDLDLYFGPPQATRRPAGLAMRPDFTGTWKLIRGESDFGFLAPPEWRLDTITHQDPQVRIRTSQKDANGDISVDRDLTVGGEPVTIMIRGRERRIIAFWEDAVLAVETRSEVSGNARRNEDRRSMDAGGQWLTIERLRETARWGCEATPAPAASTSAGGYPSGPAHLNLTVPAVGLQTAAPVTESGAVPMAPESGIV